MFIQYCSDWVARVGHIAVTTQFMIMCQVILFFLSSKKPGFHGVINFSYLKGMSNKISLSYWKELLKLYQICHILLCS